MSIDLDLFGLSVNQTKILFSIDKYLVEVDINDSGQNQKKLKREWLNEWEKGIIAYLNSLDNSIVSLYGLYDIHEQVKFEKENNNRLTWYYLVLLEATLFSAYSPIDENIKKYKSLRFKNHLDILKKFVAAESIINESYIDSITDTYSYAIKEIAGEKRLVGKLLPAIALATVVGALCFSFAGPIAVALVGSHFAGLYGAALTNACLALLGGGALATGGAGMAGGTAVIVGGGSILGFTAGDKLGKALISSPQFILHDSVKFYTAFICIYMGVDYDKKAASKILGLYQEKISELKNYCEMNIDDSMLKKDIKKSISYMENIYSSCEDYYIHEMR